MKSHAPPIHWAYGISWGVHGLWTVIVYLRGLPFWEVVANLSVFGLLEGIAVFARKLPGDTLSEFMQSISGKVPLGSDVRWYQSWNGLVSVFAFLYAFQGGYIIAHGSGWFPVGIIVTGLLFTFLLYHWLRPRKYG